MNDYVKCIVDYIKSGLKGEYEADMAWLGQCSDKYSNDEDSSEILAEIAKMMFEILPEEEKNKVNQHFDEMQSDISKQYEQVKEMVKVGDLLAAKDLMEKVLGAVADVFKSTDELDYLSFNHITEYYIYSYKHKTNKQIYQTDIPYNEYYRTYGMILNSLKDSNAAIEALEKALEWNPVDLDTVLALGEAYKVIDNSKKFLEYTVMAYPLCCTRATMARYYRNMSYYFIKQYQPVLAGALLVYSNIYYKTEQADEQIRFIESALEEKVPEYSIKEIHQMLKEAEIPAGPDPDTIGIIYRVGELMLDAGRNGEATDCFSIVYDITQDPEAKAYLDKLTQ